MTPRAGLTPMRPGLSFLILILGFVSVRPVGVSAAAFESLGMGARSAAMGGSFVAVLDDYQSVFFNPAGLGRVREKILHSEYRSLFGLGLLRYMSTGYVHPGVGRGTVGLSWLRMDTIGDASYLDYSENTLVFSYGTNVFSPFYVGVNGKYYRAHSTIGGSGMGLDFGLGYQWRAVTLGAALQDLNRTMISWDSGAKDRIPLRLRAGVSSRPWKETLISAQVQWEDQENRSHHLGFEQALYRRAFFLRFGGVERDNDWRFSWGLGLKIKLLTFDYAWERQRLLGDTQVFAASVKF